MRDPNLEIMGEGGGAGLPKNFFRPFGPQFGLKVRGGPLAPRLLPWIRHWYSVLSVGRTRTDLISLSHSRLLATTDGRSYLIRPLSLCSWSMNVGAWLMTALSVCRVLVPKEFVGKQYHSCFFNVQWPLNYSLRIWRRLKLEAGPRTAVCSVTVISSSIVVWTQQVYKKSSSHK